MFIYNVLYFKAVQYYENSLRTNDVFSLRYDLARVYLRLSNLDKAERTVQKGLEQDTGTVHVDSRTMSLDLLIAISHIFIREVILTQETDFSV